MDNVTHYTCTACGGVSPDAKTCDTPGCTHAGTALKPCGCTDGAHGGAPHAEV